MHEVCSGWRFGDRGRRMVLVVGSSAASLGEGWVALCVHGEGAVVFWGVEVW